MFDNLINNSVHLFLPMIRYQLADLLSCVRSKKIISLHAQTIKVFSPQFLSNMYFLIDNLNAEYLSICSFILPTLSFFKVILVIRKILNLLMHLFVNVTHLIRLILHPPTSPTPSNYKFYFFSWPLCVATRTRFLLKTACRLKRLPC